MLKLVDICKDYKVEQESIHALRNVSIEFRRNEFVAILGPSGCGKTTLLNIIGGLDRYTSGDIQIEGISTKEYDDVDWDTYRNRRIGFVFQSYNLIPHMNILKNVALSLTLAGVGKEERTRRAMEALDKVGLAEQARKRPSQLSGGQMQRVAIARALVNNPEIILADEPTGALDSESGIQVMDLLKEVASDRLVIMVTHNPQLADQYSTRIVNFKDGEVVGDTRPYCAANKEDDLPEFRAYAASPVAGETTEQRLERIRRSIARSEAKIARLDAEIEHIHTGGTAQHADEASKTQDETPDQSKQSKKAKAKEAKHASMKLGTAIGLSWNNLISKKGRTFLTSIAGSIGIIGIILVLALSNGASNYITSLEESALSNYPISVKQSNLDIQSLLGTMMSAMADTSEKGSDDQIRVQEVMGKLIPTVKDQMLNSAGNDLYAFKQYIDANFEYEVGGVASVQYDYGTVFNVYAEDRNHVGERYMKINPYTETMMDVIGNVSDSGVLGSLSELEIFGMSFDQAVEYMASMFSGVWSELSSNQNMLDSQYELVGSRSHWPRSANEIVVVVSNNNTLLDFQLFMLGLQSEDEVMDALAGGNFATDKVYDVDDILGLEYKVLTNVDYLEENPDEPGTYIEHNHTEKGKQWVDDHAVHFGAEETTLKVVGIVRPKVGAVASSISGIVGYPKELTDLLISHAADSVAVKAMEKAFEQSESGMYSNIIEFEDIDNNNRKYEIGDTLNEKQHKDLMRALGFADKDYPSAINFYCHSFEAKRVVEQFIDGYNEGKSKKDQISYSDSLGSMMNFIDTMATTITGVLVAFAAISLVVSTIMIAIIIYTSVLERRKEIGVLRSIGARKKDISRVFIAESGILGGYAGVIGCAVSVFISWLGSFILKQVYGIQGLMSVTWWHCVLMLGISILLSVLAGFIPSRIAANKDPAIALRSE